MSKVRLTGSTSGYTEITAPATAGNNTITLPASNGTANQLLKNSGTAGALEYATATLDSSGNLNNIASINSGPLAGFRNAIINGNFDIWQRGTSFTATEYAADRWLTGNAGTTKTASRQSFTLGQTEVPGEPVYFMRHVVTSVAGASNSATLQQRFEGVRSFAGQQVTVSFWAKADAAKPIAVELFQRFGTGGSPSADVSGIGATKMTLGTAWQKFTVTAAVPSISGKTLGSNGNDFLAVFFWFDAGSNFNSRTNSLGQQSGTFDIAQVQVEPGPVATPFERRPIGTELALCQRYYEQSDGSGVGGRVGWSGYSTSGVDFYGTYYFKVPKRAAPTVVATNIDAVNFAATSGTILADTLGFREARAANATGGNGRFFSTFTASAEL